MRFEDERYVRVYTRDTMTMVMLPWEARAVFWEVLRKVDRAGIIDLGEYGARGLSAMLHMPADVVERQLPELVAAKVVELRGRILVVPRFVEAQEAKASDKARQQAARERARDAARAESVGIHATNENITPRYSSVTDSDIAVTCSDESSRQKSSRHTTSHDVTLSRTEPSRTTPNDTNPEPASPTRSVASSGGRRKKSGTLTSMPDDFAVSRAIEDMCRAEGLPDPHVVFRDFKDTAAAKGYRYIDWEAAFRKWMRSDITRRSYPKWETEEPLTTLPILRLPNRDDFIPADDDELDLGPLFGDSP